MSKHGHSPGHGAAHGSGVETAEAKGSEDIRAEKGDAAPSTGRENAAENPAPGTQTAEDSEAEPLSWEQKCAELEAKFADLNDQYLRKAADFENYRKRMNREKQEITEFANQNLLLDLLPVLDDFERAIKSAQSSLAAQSSQAAQTSKDFTSFYEGVTMIQKRLSTELENKWGLKRFDSAGQPFDPNRHEALQMEKAAGISEAVVSEDFVKGYLLKDRVLRCAKVKVMMPQEEETGDQRPGAGDTSP